MFRNNFKIALRSLKKNKAYTAINILGLAAGMASFIIVLLALNYELSYDTWDPELRQVHKVSMRVKDEIFEATPAPLASFLNEKYPKVEAATSLQGTGEYEILISANEKSIYQKGFTSADSLFLQVFPYHLSQGNRTTAFNAPNAVLISEELSQKLFGDANPMGETIKVFNVMEGVITGVMELPETPSHRNMHLVMRDPYEQQNFFWNNHSYETYIKLHQQIPELELEKDLNRIYFEERILQDENLKEAYKKSDNKTILFTDSVPDIQNFSKYGSSNIKTISILFILAVLLLLIGAINFSNLTVAKSLGRTQEIGVRKVLGSGRKNLIFQFMSETSLQCAISLIIALSVVLISLPYINSSLNLQLSFWAQNSWSLFLQIGLCLFILVLLSGIYPSFYLSGFKIVNVLKGNISFGNKEWSFRNILVIFQFMVTVFFVIVILGVNKQLHFIQNKDKGFTGEQVMRIEATQPTREEGFQQARNALLSIPGVSSISKTTTVPGDKIADSSTYNFDYKGEKIRMGSVKVSTDYFKTLEVPLLAGRYFNESFADQNTRNAIINETAARKLSSNPIGETISFGGCDEGTVKIVGIVNDINVHGFQSNVKPAVYTIENKACMYQSGGAILVKLKSDNINSSITEIQEEWKLIEPDFPLRYSFLDANFEKLFSSYLRLEKIISFFGGIAILISIMGLFALTAFMIRQRNKEIGIRKVLGANIKDLTALLGRDFLILVFIASLIAIPIGYWALNEWLQDFAYRTTIQWWIFVTAASTVFLIALSIVSFQTVKTALQNPVKSLRTE
ncbi:ABC transporter permease [Christiangramia sp.]|uniref:ABC transporter permease n=1 Tax=Christiangramia sp. TaxID=1931228 RepID=UPI002625803B|nr:ABC transporter permease [Christiangramia sp.]